MMTENCRSLIEDIDRTQLEFLTAEVIIVINWSTIREAISKNKSRFYGSASYTLKVKVSWVVTPIETMTKTKTMTMTM